MTLLDALRPSAPAGTSRGGWLRSGWLAGAVTALLSLVPVLLLSALAGASAAPRGGDLEAAFGVGAAGWLLAHGARLALGGGVLALTPLLLLLVLVLLAARGARRALEGVEDDGPLWRGIVETGRARALGEFVGAYAAVGVAATLLTLLGPTRPTWLSLLPALLGVPLTGAVVALGRFVAEEDEASLWAGLGVPLVVRRAVPAALRGAGLAVAVGSGLVVLAVLLHLDRVGHVGAELAPGLLGGLLLWGGQLAALPNLGLWALSFLAGPGYALSDGASVSWSGAEGGLLPLVPVLAASPQPGALPVVTAGLVLVPVALGVLTGRRALADVPRLASTRTKVQVAGTAALLASAGLALVDAVGGGSLGGFRLASLGAPALSLALALALELTLGALAAVAGDVWRLHRR